MPLPGSLPPGLILDCDAGIDDAQALFALLRAHERGNVRLLCIICTAGNCALDDVIGNVCATLAAYSSVISIPVYVGSSRPLVKPTTPASEWHGADGLGGLGLGRAASRHVVDTTRHGANVLLDVARAEFSEGRRVQLLVTGPCTTLALALRLQRDTELERAVSRLVLMGGAYQARGNTSAAASEYNIAEDPEAAAIVMGTRWECDFAALVTWEVTMQHGLPARAVDAWLGSGSPRSRFLGSISQHLLRASEAVDPARFKSTGFFIPDPLAAVVMLRPDAVTSKTDEPVGVVVETAGTFSRGQTIVQWGGQNAELAPRVWTIVKSVSNAIVEEVLVDSVQP